MHSIALVILSEEQLLLVCAAQLCACVEMLVCGAFGHENYLLCPLCSSELSREIAHRNKSPAAADIVEIKHILLPADEKKFKDIFVVFELMETDLHQVRLPIAALRSH